MKFFWIIFIPFLYIFQSYTLKAETIIIVDKGKRILELRKDKKIIANYEVGLGLKSPLPKEKRGDFLTPEGIYQIIDIRPSEEYKYFLELNYPNINDLSLAYYRGVISRKRFIRLFKIAKKCKPIFNTPLGNSIGIHGGGAFKIEKRNGDTYKDHYWTKGCIALNNRDLMKLVKQVQIGQKVFILNSKKRLYDILKKFVYPVKIKPLEIFEGELYLKLNEYTYLDFYLVEHFQGLRKLIIKVWIRGALKEKIESDGEGNILDKEKEKYFKKLLIENLENLLKPYTQLEI